MRAKNSSRSSSRSSSSSKNSSQPKTLWQEYLSLTDAGKLKFFNENKDALQKALDLSDYKNVLREIYAIAEQSTRPAASKSSGYYK